MAIEYTILDDENSVEILGEILRVPVSVDEVKETKMGESKGEEYFNEERHNIETIMVELPVEYVGEENNPSKELGEEETKKIFDEIRQRDYEFIDYETIKFKHNRTVYVASYDSSPLKKYQ